MIKIILIIVLAIIAFIILEFAFGWFLGGIKMKAVRKRGILPLPDDLKDDKEKKR